jgi:hypothetical protein
MFDMKGKLPFVVCQERRRRAPLVVGVVAPEDLVIRPLIVAALIGRLVGILLVSACRCSGGSAACPCNLNVSCFL